MTNPKEVCEAFGISDNEAALMELSYLGEQVNEVKENIDKKLARTNKEILEKAIKKRDDRLNYKRALIEKSKNQDMPESSYDYIRLEIKDIDCELNDLEKKISFLSSKKNQTKSFNIEVIKEQCLCKDYMPTPAAYESNGRTKYLCPFHDEKTPSFIIDAKNKYHCFGCGKHGDVISLVMHLFNETFVETCKRLSNIQ